MSGKHMFFKNINNPPPGGMYFYETHGHRIAAKTFLQIELTVRHLMEKYGINGLPEEEVARYMSTRIPNPGAYIVGMEAGAGAGGKSVPVSTPHVTARDAIANTLPYCSRQVVPFDVIERRMQKCASCPKHARDWCPTCSGHVSRMMSAFGGRRTKLPVDSVSGVCQCAKAYEMAIASVEYAPDEKIWDGAPDTCWRKQDV